MNCIQISAVIISAVLGQRHETTRGVDTELHTACRAGSLDTVVHLLANHHDEAETFLNLRGIGGQTPLIAAAIVGADHVIVYLLERGANMTLMDDDGYDAMDFAAFHGQAATARVLALRGIPVDRLHHDGYAPIHRAAWGTGQNHADTLSTLMKLKASATARAMNGKLPIEMTTNKNSKRVLKSSTHKPKDSYRGRFDYFKFLQLLVPIGVLLFSWNMTRVFRANKSQLKCKSKEQYSSDKFDISDDIPQHTKKDN
jgi:ankyrin repeat protein